MEAAFSQKITVSEMNTDCFGRLRPSALLSIAQEVSACHCRALSLGAEALAQRHLMWAIVRNRVQITRLPLAGEEITVETWPLPTTRAAFPRSVVAYDEKGNELFRCLCLWVLMNTDTRAMILPGKSGISVAGSVRGGELAMPDSLLPVPGGSQTLRTVRFSDLDRNGHMNNARWLDWLADLLPAAFHGSHGVCAMTLCYRSEAREGEALRLNWLLGGDGCLRAEARRDSGSEAENGQVVFSAEVRFS